MCRNNWSGFVYIHHPWICEVVIFGRSESSQILKLPQKFIQSVCVHIHLLYAQLPCIGLTSALYAPTVAFRSCSNLTLEYGSISWIFFPVANDQEYPTAHKLYPCLLSLKFLATWETILDILRSNSSEEATPQKENHLIPDLAIVWVLSYAPPKTTIGLLSARHLSRAFQSVLEDVSWLEGTCYFTIAALPPEMPLPRASAAVRHLPTPTQPWFFTEYETQGRALRKLFIQECESKNESPYWQSIYKNSRVLALKIRITWSFKLFLPVEVWSTWTKSIPSKCYPIKIWSIAAEPLPKLTDEWRQPTPSWPFPAWGQLLAKTDGGNRLSEWHSNFGQGEFSGFP